MRIMLSSSVEMEFARVNPGSFVMGRESPSPALFEVPPHAVAISRPYFIATTPVTCEQFACFSAGHPEQKSGDSGSDVLQHPVADLTWFMAMMFCEWLTLTFREQIPKSFRAALPTEAQWEFACRAGTQTEYFSGDGEDALDGVGWYDRNSGDCSHPVAQKAPNSLGLYDVHGNVWEWCRDGFSEDAYEERLRGVADPFIPYSAESPYRVIRGGSSVDLAYECESAACGMADFADCSPYVGFRVSLVTDDVGLP